MAKQKYICKDCGENLKCELAAKETDGTIEPKYCPYSSIRNAVNWKLKKKKEKKPREYPIGYCLSCGNSVYIGELGIPKPTCSCKDITHISHDTSSKYIRTPHGDILQVYVGGKQ